MTPSVTILLPVHNSASTLKETLDSLWAQTHRDFELLVVDDGSSDETPEILATEKDSRLRVIRNPECLRLPGALNRGLEEASAALVARMDADDLAHPTRIEKQAAFMNAHPDVVVCGTWTRLFGDRSKACEIYPVHWDALRAFCLFNCPFSHPSVMFRNDVFREQGIAYNPACYITEDFDLWSRVVHRFPCANLPEVLLDYRVHGKSITGSDWNNLDEIASQVILRQFRSLGVACDEALSRLHRDIGMARVSPVKMEEAAEHLGRLLQLNQENEFCPPAAFAREVESRWFHVCMNVRGVARDRFYRDPGIWGTCKPPLKNRALLKASMLRERGGG